MKNNKLKNIIMKNNFNKIKLVVLLILVLVSSNSFSQSPSSPKEVIAVFPYQHVNEASAALASMSNWGNSDWKSFFKLSEDTSLKVKFSFALHAYVNKVALDGKNIKSFVKILSNQLKKAKSEDTKIFFSEMLNLLTDNNNVSARLNLLPAQPSLEVTQNKLPNSTQLLLDLYKRTEQGLNTIEKENSRNTFFCKVIMI